MNQIYNKEEIEEKIREWDEEDQTYPEDNYDKEQE
jgi:hypothetical protein